MLTEELKQKLILKLLDLDSSPSEQSDELIGKTCMFRTYSAGVHFGILKNRNGKECLVTDSRRVYSWAKACSLSQLAMDGSGDLASCKIAMQVGAILLTEVIEIIPMEKKAIDNLYGCPVWKS